MTPAQRERAFTIRLRYAIHTKGVTNQYLAKHLGVSSSTVGDWVNHGAMPGGKALLTLPNLLNVSADWLLGTRKGKSLPSPTYADGARHALVEVETLVRELKKRW